MKPRPRLRTTTTRLAAAAAVLLLEVGLASGRYWIDWGFKGGWSVALRSARLRVEHLALSPYTRWPRGPELHTQRFALDGRVYFESVPQDWIVVVPLWMPLLCTILIAAAGLGLEARARRRARTGECFTCRYDRGGLPPNAPCPECGRTP